ncbi:hypothetical protein [Chryseobacterium sp. 18068]|uniref:hypothetical protein n=1 Tax=Chryseobacterium sp. 18068 TaxID=2681414 RepID=UPI001358214A|nr:hypothetical protein [Chryseobacterium sp. 18068]
MDPKINETINIQLSSEVTSLWKEGDIAKFAELKNELENSDHLITFLSRYQKERWKAESIDYIEIMENPNELHISYTISNFSGCKDMEKEDDDNIVVEYKINLESEEIEIIGQPIPEDRSTFEEY